MRIVRICEYCGVEFTAKTSVTRFCSRKCTSRFFKKKDRDKKIEKSNEETFQHKIAAASDPNLEIIKLKEFLSIKETISLLGLSERTFYRLMKNGNIPATKLGGRTIIKRSIIDSLFVKPTE